MPELPEVETVRRGLARCMTGRRIVRAELRRPDLRRPFPPMLASRLDGARIGAFMRRGKYILIELDETGLLLLHLGMSGRIKTGTGEAPDQKHDHVILRLDDGTGLQSVNPVMNDVAPLRDQALAIWLGNRHTLGSPLGGGQPVQIERNSCSIYTLRPSLEARLVAKAIANVRRLSRASLCGRRCARSAAAKAGVNALFACSGGVGSSATVLDAAGSSIETNSAMPTASACTSPDPESRPT